MHHEARSSDTKLNPRDRFKSVPDTHDIFFFSSPEPKAQAELIVYRSSRRPSVCASVRP